MRISPTLSAVALFTVTAITAHGQQSGGSGVVRSGAVPTKAPTGMSFAYDAQHSQITSNGVQLKTVTLKSNNVSPTTGTINVIINIKSLSRFEAGTTYHCSVYAIGGIIDLDTSTVDGGIENANTFASGSGGTYTCRFRIPYSWTLANDHGADSGLIIAFGAAAVNTHSEVQHSTLQVDGIENLPVSGTTSTFIYNVAL